MTIEITGEQATHLAGLVHEIRPDWDLPGIRAALWKVRDRPTALIAYAAVRAAQSPSNRTPAVIALDGSHWRPPAPTELPTPRPRRRCDRCDGFWFDTDGTCIDCQLRDAPARPAPPADHSIATARAAIAAVRNVLDPAEETG